MRVTSHVALSIVVAGASYLATKSPEIAVASFLSGWLVDVDHAIDLVRERVWPYIKVKKMTLLLHSWELLLVLAIISSVLKSPLLNWIGIAYLLHLFTDYLVYRPSLLWYSFVWRGMHNFDSKYSGHINTLTTLQGLLIIDALYLVGYCTILSPYKVILAPPTTLHQVFNALQWFIPSVLFLVLIFSRWLRPVLNIRFWTAVGVIIVAIFITLEINSVKGNLGSWSSLGLCMLVLMTAANAFEEKLGNVKAAIMGLEIMFLSIATFEILYQVGVLFYHNFFDEPKFDFFVVVCQNLLWIVPCVIALLWWHDKKLFQWNKYSTICLITAAIFTIVWFATKMTIPLMFYGIKGPFDAHPNPVLLAVSRGAQGFVCAAIVSCFIPSFSRVSTLKEAVSETS
jgi:hypothetical protein